MRLPCNSYRATCVFHSYTETLLTSGNFRHPPRAGSAYATWLHRRQTNAWQFLIIGSARMLNRHGNCHFRCWFPMVVEFSPQIGIQSSSNENKNKNRNKNKNNNNSSNNNNNHNHHSQTIWSGNAEPMKTPTQGNHKKNTKNMFTNPGAKVPICFQQHRFSARNPGVLLLFAQTNPHKLTQRMQAATRATIDTSDTSNIGNDTSDIGYTEIMIDCLMHRFISHTPNVS